MKRTRVLLFLAIFSVASLAYAADCIERNVQDMPEVFSACKTWPAFPDWQIAANATFQQGSEFTPSSKVGEGLYDLDIALLDAKVNTPVAKTYEAGAIESDAVAFEDLVIDTARYQLASNVRAFGIRILNKHRSGVTPFEEGALTLYTKEGGNLRAILRELVVYKYSAERFDDCESTHSETNRTVAIGKTQSHGFNDLVVTTVNTFNQDVLVKGKCKQERSTERTQETIHYDGHRYVVPDTLR